VSLLTMSSKRAWLHLPFGVTEFSSIEVSSICTPVVGLCAQSWGLPSSLRWRRARRAGNKGHVHPPQASAQQRLGRQTDWSRCWGAPRRGWKKRRPAKAYLVDNNDKLLHSEGLGKKSMLARLTTSFVPRFKLSFARRDDKHSHVRLRRAGDHVGHEVLVARCIQDCIPSNQPTTSSPRPPACHH
jgi:hypothetical protein